MNECTMCFFAQYYVVGFLFLCFQKHEKGISCSCGHIFRASSCRAHFVFKHNFVISFATAATATATASTSRTGVSVTVPSCVCATTHPIIFVHVMRIRCLHGFARFCPIVHAETIGRLSHSGQRLVLRCVHGVMIIFFFVACPLYTGHIKQSSFLLLCFRPESGGRSVMYEHIQ